MLTSRKIIATNREIEDYSINRKSNAINIISLITLNRNILKITRISTSRKDMIWSGIWGVDIIPRYDMVLRSYYLIFMG